ncbi:MAG: hypothetical protein QOE23_2783 [Pseudonocardiales bacterium]|jgi:hypothetical protein|nr:hypothetical protein [Pseudonocardiales bacterium]
MAPAPLITQFVNGLTEEDRKRLRQVLNLAANADIEAIAVALEPFAAAALAEYVDQFTGRQIPTRMKDFEQLRLLYMARFAFGGQLPSPDRVADLFQRNASESKLLLRNTATRYRYELAASMNDAVWRVLISLSKKSGDDLWSVEVRDLALLDHMTEAVRRGPGNPKGIERSQKEMHVYLVDKATMSTLLSFIGHTYDEFKAARR